MMWPFKQLVSRIDQFSLVYNDLILCLRYFEFYRFPTKTSSSPLLPLYMSQDQLKNSFPSVFSSCAASQPLNHLIRVIPQPLTIIFFTIQIHIKLRKMEEFLGEQHIDGKELNEHSQDPFMVVHGFRRLIAKQRRKALRKANKQRKKLLIPSPSLADTFQEVQERHQIENQLGESVWEVFNVGESNKFQYQLFSAELLVQSNQISHQVEYSSQKSENATSMGETLVMRRKIFAEEFVAFCYSEC